VEEYIHLSKIENFTCFKKIVEIGAGFGRTCHVLLTMNDSIEEYIIIDLPQMIELSKIYLKKVIPNNFFKIKFISCEDIKEFYKTPSDLVININSLNWIN
jgi:putative sugar O-methyltransferase